MKKFISMMMVVAMLVVMSAVAVSAADFIPSVGIDTTVPEASEFEIIVTPYDKINDADEKADKEGLQEAYDELKDADDLSDIVDGIKEGSTVRDLFDVAFDEDKAPVEVKLDVNLPDDNFQVIFHDEDGWKLINGKRNSDGSVTVKLDKPGQVAILVHEGKPDAPQTSDAFLAALICMVVAGTALTAVVVRRRHSN